jgi:hypothetical protein
MSNHKILNAATNAFKQMFSDFCQNSDNSFATFNNRSFELMTKGLMAAAQSAGQAGLEEYLKQNDTVQPTITENMATYRYKGQSSNELLTLFGIVTVERAMYYNEADGGQYLFPLDRALGLEKDDFATLETREMILFASSSCVPQEVADLLEKSSLCRPSRTAIQNIINKDGAAMDALRDELARNVFKENTVPPSTQALVVSLDGVNVLLREPGEKKGRKNKRANETTSTTIAPTSYHNAMVGSASFYGMDKEDKPQRLSSIYTARMPQEKSVAFKDDFERMIFVVEEKITATGKSLPKILLTDGHLMIKGFAHESTVLQRYEKLLDFYHATEHLSKAAEAMYGEKTDMAKWWYSKWRAALKTESNAPAAILRSMNGFQLRTKLSTKRSEELKTEITFFRKNKKLMKYQDFISRGLPIGSGPIEAAAKTIVKQRMCRSGMSWSRTKGQHVLTIRAFVQSGLWENAWSQYKTLKKAA